jgi:hypothetical protein
VFRKAGLRDECVNFFDQFLFHGDKIHALACKSIHAITFMSRTPPRVKCAA